MRAFSPYAFSKTGLISCRRIWKGSMDTYRFVKDPNSNAPQSTERIPLRAHHSLSVLHDPSLVDNDDTTREDTRTLAFFDLLVHTQSVFGIASNSILKIPLS